MGKNKRWCYIGPKESYVVVNRPFSSKSLGLRNILESDWEEIASRAIMNIVEEASENVKEAIKKLENIKHLIEIELSKLTSSESKS